MATQFYIKRMNIRASKSPGKFNTATEPLIEKGLKLFQIPSEKLEDASTFVLRSEEKHSEVQVVRLNNSTAYIRLWKLELAVWKFVNNVHAKYLPKMCENVHLWVRSQYSYKQTLDVKFDTNKFWMDAQWQQNNSSLQTGIETVDLLIGEEATNRFAFGTGISAIWAEIFSLFPLVQFQVV